MKSPAFSSFRQLMDDWDDDLVLERKAAVKSMLDHPGLVIFFKNGNSIFGGPEESRIVYAKLKSDDEDKTWKDEASFGGLDLMKALSGEKTQSLFGSHDLPKIKLLTDKDELCKMMDKHASKASDPIAGIKKWLSLLGGADEE